MKPYILILSVVASTVTIFLTGSVVYPTRAEVDGKIEGYRQRLDSIERSVLRTEEKLDRLVEKFIK